MKRFLPIALLAGALSAQSIPPTYIGQTKFQTGQDVVPSYEGWLRNTDGTFTMVFGYLNRNWKEEPVIPVGDDNKLEPGPVDRGQPTYFLPRRQAFIFRVVLPQEWDPKQELVWTLKVNGRTEKAYGTLSADEEITERMIMTRGGLSPGEDDPNKPPVISVADPVGPAQAGLPIQLVATVTDDGLPKPRAAPKPRAGGAPAQTNSVEAPRARGLSVTWLEYRGPAKVAFDSTRSIQPTVTFSAPGTYVLQAIASDGALATRTSVTITVN
jgi:hypothetical protein